MWWSRGRCVCLVCLAALAAIVSAQPEDYPAPPATHCFTYTTYDQTDLWGFDLEQRTGVASLEACREWCARVDACAAFEWVAGADRDNKCLLKSGFDQNAMFLEPDATLGVCGSNFSSSSTGPVVPPDTCTAATCAECVRDFSCGWCRGGDGDDDYCQSKNVMRECVAVTSCSDPDPVPHPAGDPVTSASIVCAALVCVLVPAAIVALACWTQHALGHKRTIMSWLEPGQQARAAPAAALRSLYLRALVPGLLAGLCVGGAMVVPWIIVRQPNGDEVWVSLWTAAPDSSLGRGQLATLAHVAYTTMRVAMGASFVALLVCPFIARVRAGTCCSGANQLTVAVQRTYAWWSWLIYTVVAALDAVAVGAVPAYLPMAAGVTYSVGYWATWVAVVLFVLLLVHAHAGLRLLDVCTELGVQSLVIPPARPQPPQPPLNLQQPPPQPQPFFPAPAPSYYAQLPPPAPAPGQPVYVAYMPYPQAQPAQVQAQQWYYAPAPPPPFAQAAAAAAPPAPSPAGLSTNEEPPHAQVSTA